MHPYRKFITMIATSTVVMLALMYFNTYALDHVHWSETRFYMAFLMGGVMGLVMFAFMSGMYPDQAKNKMLVGGSLLVAVLALALVRSQVTVDDVDYMGAMIPHHSIAVLTSERANIMDLRVQKLAKDIRDTQVKEIAEMKWLIDDIKANGVATDAATAAGRPVPAMSAQ